MNGRIYEITNLVNGKRYFGQTLYPLSRRWRNHKSKAKTGEGYLYRSIRKYGLKSFKIAVIVDNISNKEELNRLEKVWIEACHTTDPELGYNMTYGGEGGLPTEAVRLKLSKGRKGKPAWNRGIPRSEEQRNQRAEWNKNRTVIVSDFTREKLSLAATGRRVSDETREKISIAKFGKTHSIETKEKMCASQRTAWAKRKANGD